MRAEASTVRTHVKPVLKPHEYFPSRRVEVVCLCWKKQCHYFISSLYSELKSCDRQFAEQEGVALPQQKGNFLRESQYNHSKNSKLKRQGTGLTMCCCSKNISKYMCFNGHCWLKLLFLSLCAAVTACPFIAASYLSPHSLGLWGILRKEVWPSARLPGPVKECIKNDPLVFLSTH